MAAAIPGRRAARSCGGRPLGPWHLLGLLGSAGLALWACDATTAFARYSFASLAHSRASRLPLAAIGSGADLKLPPLSERVFLVTGSTDGIGRFTAEQLAKQGCTVLVHGRDVQRLQRTVKELKRLAPSASVYKFKADLSSMAEVRRLAKAIGAEFPRIHGLLNNAGTFDGDYTGARQVTPEGNEYSLAVNVMAPFLLTSLLLPNVRASGAGRVLVTSSLSKGASDALGDLQCQRWDAHRAYSLSKLCTAMIIKELDARYGDAPRLCFHTMDPGTVDTKMLRAGWWSGGSSVRTATTSFRMLTDDSFQARSGQTVGISDDASMRSASARKRLWEDLEALTGAEWPVLACVE